MFTKPSLLWSSFLKVSEIRDSFKSKSISTLDPELNLTHLSRSTESVCFASVIDHRTLWVSTTLDPVVKMEVEVLNQIYQTSSISITSATFHRWHLSSPALPALMPQPPAKPQSFPITSSPPHQAQSKANQCRQ